MVKVLDWIYNPFKDNICMLFHAPELGAYVTLEFSRHEDIIEQVKKAKNVDELIVMLK